MTTNYSDFFSKINGFKSYEWQARFGEAPDCENRLISVPTGLGKTLSVLTAWLFHRAYLNEESWPRRLVFCLPMRVLVEQTLGVAQSITDNFKKKFPEKRQPETDVLMGGEDAGDWALYPEREAILVGTQDMLLSRALNRGYAAARARWPVEFGLLNSDALWILDEIQLMSDGFLTANQIQAFFEKDKEQSLRPRCCWWMSATLAEHWFETGDIAKHKPSGIIRPDETPDFLKDSKKTLRIIDLPEREAKVDNKKNNEGDKDCSKWAALIVEEHLNILNRPEKGRLTLAVANRVNDAVSIFKAIKKYLAKREPEAKVDVCLVHSRFRSMEREKWRESFLERSCRDHDTDRIIVATQVVEAGVDLNADLLITELAPFASLVQRFGRCARSGGEGKVVIVDRKLSGKDCAPYEEADLAAAEEAISRLKDVSVPSLEELLAKLQEQEPDLYKRLMHFESTHILTRREFIELFDTGPDLTGSDIDISCYIRSGEERDVRVFWREIPPDGPPSDCYPHRKELCPVPVYKASQWLKKKHLARRAWIRDFVDDEWIHFDANRLYPGLVILVGAECGGYDETLGWTGAAPRKKDKPVKPNVESATAGDDAGFGRDDRSQDAWKTIATHCLETAEEAKVLADEIGIEQAIGETLELAARLHDLGKAHKVFQKVIDKRFPVTKGRNYIAKAPKAAWKRRYDRPGFRHEFASALTLLSGLALSHPLHPAILGESLELMEALGVDPPVEPDEASDPVRDRLSKLSTDDFNLLLHLVSAHHGKARISIHATPHDQNAAQKLESGETVMPLLGVLDGDVIPELELGNGFHVNETRLSLEPMALGFSIRFGPSWTERMLKLIESRGVFALGFLEALLRCADVRASKRRSNDPILAGGYE